MIKLHSNFTFRVDPVYLTYKMCPMEIVEWVNINLICSYDELLTKLLQKKNFCEVSQNGYLWFLSSVLKKLAIFVFISDTFKNIIYFCFRYFLEKTTVLLRKKSILYFLRTISWRKFIIILPHIHQIVSI